MPPLNAKSSLMAGALAAIGASLCCLGPLVLLSLGIGGAWVGSLTALEPFRPLFTALTLLFIALAFRRLYLAQPACASGMPCDDTRVIQRQRLTFWAVTVLLLGLLAGPWIAPMFY